MNASTHPPTSRGFRPTLWVSMGLLALFLLPSVAFAGTETQSAQITASGAGETITLTFTDADLANAKGVVLATVSLFGDFQADGQYADLAFEGSYTRKMNPQSNNCDAAPAASGQTQQFVLPAAQVAAAANTYTVTVTLPTGVTTACTVGANAPKVSVTLEWTTSSCITHYDEQIIDLATQNNTNVNLTLPSGGVKAGEKAIVSVRVLGDVNDSDGTETVDVYVNNVLKDKLIGNASTSCNYAPGLGTANTFEYATLPNPLPMKVIASAGVDVAGACLQNQAVVSVTIVTESCTPSCNNPVPTALDNMCLLQSGTAPYCVSGTCGECPAAADDSSYCINKPGGLGKQTPHCSASFKCVQCRADSDCPATYACNTTTNKCECTQTSCADICFDDHSPITTPDTYCTSRDSNKPYCINRLCQECTDSAPTATNAACQARDPLRPSCVGFACKECPYATLSNYSQCSLNFVGKPHCYNYKCSECALDSDCIGQGNYCQDGVCNKLSSCQSCVDDAWCAANTGTCGSTLKYCRPKDAWCVECLSDAHCSGNLKCGITNNCVKDACPATCTKDSDCLIADCGTKTRCLANQCQDVSTAAQCQPPYLMVVLDKSCSMGYTPLVDSGKACSSTTECTDPARFFSSIQCKIGNETYTTCHYMRWDVAVNSLKSIFTEYGGSPQLNYQDRRIQFGMALFDSNNYNPVDGNAPIAPLFRDPPQLAQLLDNTSPSGGTDYNDVMGVAVDHLLAKQAADPVQRRKAAILFITDGVPGHSCDTSSNASIKMNQAYNSVDTDNVQRYTKTYVVGFGGGLGSSGAKDCLNFYADQGRTKLATCDNGACFFSAENAAGLAGAMQEVINNTTAEECDGHDNDCNGLIDDGLGGNCNCTKSFTKPVHTSAIHPDNPDYKDRNITLYTFLAGFTFQGDCPLNTDPTRPSFAQMYVEVCRNNPRDAISCNRTQAMPAGNAWGVYCGRCCDNVNCVWPITHSCRTRYWASDPGIDYNTCFQECKKWCKENKYTALACLMQAGTITRVGSGYVTSLSALSFQVAAIDPDPGGDDCSSNSDCTAPAVCITPAQGQPKCTDPGSSTSTEAIASKSALGIALQYHEALGLQLKNNERNIIVNLPTNDVRTSWDGNDRPILLNLTPDNPTLPSSISSSWPDKKYKFEDNNNNLTQDMLGINACENTSECKIERTMTINMIYGRDGNKWIRRRPMGPIYHSNPVVAPAPPNNIDMASYVNFLNTDITGGIKVTARPSMLYVGSGLGMMHAFLVNTPNTTTDPLSNTLVELWAYMPKTVLGPWSTTVPTTLSSLKMATEGTRPTGGRVYTVDGHPIVKETQMFRYVDNTGAVASRWRTVLMFGFRAGGKGYVALDVTDPYKPRLLWEINNRSEKNPSTGLGTTFDRMGNTFATPHIANVLVDWPDLNGTKRIQERAVAILPAGARIDVKDRAPVYEFAKSEFQEGGAVYIVDVESGELIRELIPMSDTCGGCFNVSRGMTGAAVSNVAAPAIASRAFVGDVLGRLHRIDMQDADPSTWSIRLFFDLYKNPSNNQPIMVSPAIVLNNAGELVVFGGTGDLFHLNYITPGHNYIFSIRENLPSNAFDFSTGKIIPANVVAIPNFTFKLNRVDTFDNGTLDSTVYAGAFTGEKLTAAPVVFNNTAYFTTYTPSGSVPICGVPGEAKLYAIHFNDICQNRNCNALVPPLVETKETVSCCVQSGNNSCDATETAVDDAGMLANPTPCQTFAYAEPKLFDSATTPATAKRYISFGLNTLSMGVNISYQPGSTTIMRNAKTINTSGSSATQTSHAIQNTTKGSYFISAWPTGDNKSANKDFLSSMRVIKPNEDKKTNFFALNPSTQRIRVVINAWTSLFD